MGIFINKKVNILSPCTGRVIPLTEIGDPVFSGGMMGDGAGVVPTQGAVCAPAAGRVTSVAPTGHALTLLTGEGISIMIHIGVDTVKLGGRGFDVRVKEGAQVSAGELLVRADFVAITGAGYSSAVIVVLPDNDDYAVKAVKGSVAAGDLLFSLKKK